MSRSAVFQFEFSQETDHNKLHLYILFPKQWTVPKKGVEETVASVEWVEMSVRGVL